tara:strand:- start:530 stop:1132 length:603 start_codon:yes stop_codon:yes gene_type:complete
MKLQSYIKKIDTKEVITCVLLIVVGYMTAQLFMRKYNGFSVGGQCPTSYKCAKNNNCENISSSSVCSNSYYTGGDNIEKWCGYGKVGNKNTCHGTSNLVNNASCSKCNGSPPTPPPPGGKTPSPTPSPTPTSTPTASCSSTGFFSADKCLKNGSAVSDPSNDPDCKKLTDCHYNLFIKHWILYSVSIILFILFILGMIII